MMLLSPTGTVVVPDRMVSDGIFVSATDPAFTGALLRYSDGGLSGALTNDADIVLIDLTAPSYDDGVLIDVTLNGYLQSFGALGAGVRSILLEGLGGNDTFTTNQVLPIDVTIDGGTDSDTLAGPTAGTEWDITGPDSGSAVGITAFSNIENLQGYGSGQAEALSNWQ